MIARYPGRLRSYFRVRNDPIELLFDVVRACGDFARFDVLTYRFYLVNDPALLREALVEKSEQLIIQGGASRGLARLIGDGILTNRGERWRESRTSLQPLFHQSALTASLPVICARVQESLDRWRTRFDGIPFALNRELLALSFRIKCSALFHCLPSFEEAEEFADAIRVLQLEGMARFLDGNDLVPWLPLAVNRKVNRARATLYRLAQQLVDRGAAQPRDEILSLLFAGTESPVNTLCFALKLLEDHPLWREKIVADQCVPAEVERFDSLAQVISESIRLYPAGWAFERTASEDVRLGGELIRKGGRLLFSPFLLHRNPRFWRDPERFDPLRFDRGQSSAEGVPKYGYLPFGAGPRSCIGARLALAEMRIALGMIVAQCRWKTQSVPGEPPLKPEGSFKIRLSRPLFVTTDFRSSRTPPKTPLPTGKDASA